ncbi:anti-repressor SinI family protein [Fredinandcohnia humi]
MMKRENEKLDQEWVDLILEALDMGISVNEIKAFFIEKADELDSMIG